MEEASSLFQRFLRSYQRNEVIFEEGTQGNEMFIIYCGNVRLLKRTEKDHQSTIAILEPGEFFGEMALIDAATRSASAIAEEDNTELLVLDKPKFNYLVRQHPEFSLAIMHRLAELLRESNVQRAGGRNE